MVDVKVPVLAESISEATLMKWHKKQGDKVKRGDNLIDIETDKVTLEVAALSDGVLTEILKGDGEIVNSEEVIARIESVAKTSKPAEKKAEPQQQKVEALPEEPGQEAIQVEPSATEQPKTSPAVRTLLNENNLQASDIPDTNEDGRISKEEVIRYLDEMEKTVTTPPAASAANEAVEESIILETPEESVSEPESTNAAKAAKEQVPEAVPELHESPEIDLGDRKEERVPMTRLRQRTSERLLAAQHENAILTTFNEVNMKPIMELRSRYKEEFEKEHGVKLGFMSFFTKASTEALKRFPIINASIEGKDIIYHGYFDIGIAVSTERGLVVPIIRDADTLSFAQIETKITEFGQKARDSKLTIDELSGGTFTITNGGIFGSLLSTPILNPPQSAILGMHRIQERPMAVSGEIVILPMMYLALSYDHRIVDGRDAVQFLVEIKELLEDPARLMLQV
jgi:2-oxoglutarate dehydrogenase E2 component (dihydrolipoamide succinyltransferase)